MARHANSPSGPGKPTAEQTSEIAEDEGLTELTSESDKVGEAEGAGETPDEASAGRPRNAGNRK
jgi:hypothetical protein